MLIISYETARYERNVCICIVCRSPNIAIGAERINTEIIYIDCETNLHLISIVLCVCYPRCFCVVKKKE